MSMSTPKNIRKTLAVFTAGVFLFTQIVPPSAFAEPSKESASPQYAALPANAINPLPLPLPQADFWKDRARNIRKQNTLTLPSPSGRGVGERGNSLLKKIAPYVTVGQISDSGQKPVVYLIQDVHMNVEAQRNIGQALHEIAAHDPSIVVGVEAAYGKFNMARARLLPDPKDTRDIADALLQDNLISAPSWFGMTAEKLPRIIGVDDPALYTANVNAFKRASGLRAANSRTISENLRRLDAASAHILNPAMLKVYQSQKAYHAGQKTIFDHIRTLQAVRSSQSYPEIEKFMAAISMEKEFDPRKTQFEKERVLEILSQGKSKSMESLLQLSLSYQAGEISSVQFFMELENQMQKAGIDLSRTPNLRAYLKYVRLADSLDQSKIFAEVNAYVQSVIASLAAHSKELEFMQTVHSLQLAEKLVRFELTPEEWSECKRSSQIFDFSEGENQKSDLTSFASFYQLAEARNERMVGNLLGAKHQAQGTLVLVAGGFHSHGLVDMLKKRGASVVVLSPKFTLTNESGSEYLNSFLKEKTPLTQLFEGNKLTVANSGQLFGAPSVRGLAGSQSPDAAGPGSVLMAGIGVSKGYGVRFTSFVVRTWSNGNAWVARLTSKVAEIRLRSQRGSLIVDENSQFAQRSGAVTLVLAPLYLLLSSFFPNTFEGDEAFERYATRWTGAPLVEAVLIFGMSVFFTYLFAPGFSNETLLIATAFGTALFIFYVLHYFEHPAIPAPIPLPDHGSDFFKHSAPSVRLLQGINIPQKLYAQNFLRDDVVWRFYGILRISVVAAVLIASTALVDDMSRNVQWGILGVAALSTIRPHTRFNIGSLNKGKSTLVIGFKPAKNENVKLERREVPRSGFGKGITKWSLFAQSLVALEAAIIVAGWGILPYSIDFILLIPFALTIFHIIGLAVMPMIFKTRSAFGHRLIVPLDRIGGRKLVTLKEYFDSKKQGYLFDPSDDRSFYRRIPYAKVVWLSDLVPGVQQDQKIILINERNMDVWSQLMAYPILWFQKKIMIPSINSQKGGPHLINILILFANNLIYIPALIFAIPIIAFTIIFHIGFRIHYQIRKNKEGRILSLQQYLYLIDARDPKTNARYSKDHIEYLDRNPEAVNPMDKNPETRRAKISDMISGMTWREGAKLILKSVPPIKTTSLVDFVSYHKRLLEHQENNGKIPQEAHQFDPLPPDAPIYDITDHSKYDMDTGDTYANEAMRKGEQALVLMAGGAGRRAVANSPRVPDTMTKAILAGFLFLIDGMFGFQTAMALSLNNLHSRIPDGSRVPVSIIDQDMNHQNVVDNLRHDPNNLVKSDPFGEMDSKVQVEVHTLDGIPAWKPRGGLAYVRPEDLNMAESDGDQELTAPPGALASVMELVINGGFFKWVEKGVRYVKVVNGDDLGAIPDGNEMRVLEESNESLFFSLVERRFTYTVRIEGFDKEIDIEVVGGKRLLKTPALPEGYEVSLDGQGNVGFVKDANKWNLDALDWPSDIAAEIANFSAPLVTLRGRPCSYQITKLGFETGGTPIWDSTIGRVTIKDDREIEAPKKKPSDPQELAAWKLKKYGADKMRLAVTLYNTNQANIHVIRLLKDLGLWEGEENASPKDALKKAKAMTREERAKHVIQLMENVPPSIDAGKPSAGSTIEFHRMIWKLSDLLQIVRGGFIVIDRDGKKTRSAYLAMKNASDIHDERNYKTIAHTLRRKIQQSGSAFTLPPKQYTTVAGAAIFFIANSLFTGRDAWYPNTWGLDRQIVARHKIQKYTVKVDGDDTAIQVKFYKDTQKIKVENLPVNTTLEYLPQDDPKAAPFVCKVNGDPRAVRIVEMGADNEEEDEFEALDPRAQLRVNLNKKEVLRTIEEKLAGNDSFRPLLKNGKVSPENEAAALMRYVNLFVLNTYEMGWQFVFQKEGQYERGIPVDVETGDVTFYLAPTNFKGVHAQPFHIFLGSLNRWGVNHDFGNIDPRIIAEINERQYKPHTGPEQKFNAATEADLDLQHRQVESMRNHSSRPGIPVAALEWARNYVTGNPPQPRKQSGISALVWLDQHPALQKKVLEIRDRIRVALPPDIREKILWTDDDFLHLTLMWLDSLRGDHQYSDSELESAIEAAREYFAPLKGQELLVRGVHIDPRSMQIKVTVAPRENEISSFDSVQLLLSSDVRLNRPRVPRNMYFTLGRVAQPLDGTDFEILCQVIELLRYEVLGSILVSSVDIVQHTRALRGETKVIDSIPLTGSAYQGAPRKVVARMSVSHEGELQRVEAEVDARAERTTAPVFNMDLSASWKLYSPDGTAKEQRGIAALVWVPESLTAKILEARNELKKRLPEHIRDAIRWNDETQDERLHFTLLGLEVERGVLRFKEDHKARAFAKARQALESLPSHRLAAKGIQIYPPSMRIAVGLGPVEGDFDYVEQARNYLNRNSDGLDNPRNPQATYITIGRLIRGLNQEDFTILRDAINDFEQIAFGELPIEEIHVGAQRDVTMKDIDPIGTIKLREAEQVEPAAAAAVVPAAEGEILTDAVFARELGTMGEDMRKWMKGEKVDQGFLIHELVLYFAAIHVVPTPFIVGEFGGKDNFSDGYNLIRSWTNAVQAHGIVAMQDSISDRSSEVVKLYRILMRPINFTSEKGDPRLPLGQIDGGNYNFDLRLFVDYIRERTEKHISHELTQDGWNDDQLPVLISKNRQAIETLASQDWRFAVALNQVIKTLNLSEVEPFDETIRPGIARVKPATSLKAHMLILSVIGAVLVAAQIFAQKDGLPLVATIAATAWAALAAISAMFFGSWDQEVAETDGTTFFGELNPAYRFMPVSLQAPHRLEEFSHFVLRYERMDWTNEAYSHILTGVWLIGFGAVFALAWTFWGPTITLGGLGLGLVADIIVRVVVYVREKNTIDPIGRITSGDSIKLNSILLRGLQRSLDAGKISSDQMIQILSDHGITPETASFDLQLLRKASPSLLGAALGRPLTVKTDNKKTYLAQEAVRQSVGPLVELALESAARELVEAVSSQNDRKLDKALDHMADAMGIKSAIEGKHESKIALMTALAIGAGIQPNESFLGHLGHEVDQTESGYQPYAKARPSTFMPNPYATLYYSWEDLAAASEEVRIEQLKLIAKHMGNDNGRAGVIFAISPAQTKEALRTSLAAMMQTHGITPAGQNWDTQTLTESGLADPYSALEALKSKNSGYIVDQFVARAINPELWDFTNVEMYRRLSADAVAQIVILVLSRDSKQFMRVEESINAAMKSLKFA